MQIEKKEVDATIANKHICLLKPVLVSCTSIYFSSDKFSWISMSLFRVQRSLLFQPALRESCSQDVLARRSFLPAQKFFDVLQCSCLLISKKNFPENFYFPVRQVKDKFH